MSQTANAQYPAGKLCPEDEGALEIGIAELNGKVIIDFGKPIHWVGLTPSDTLNFARLLTQKATDIKVAEDVQRRGRDAQT